MASVTLSGLVSAQAAIDALIRDVNTQSEEMLTVILAGIAQHTAPYVPVDTSNLINSEWRTVTMTPQGPVGEIGYGRGGAITDGVPVSEYSVYVHEGSQKNWQKPGKSNLYLKRGVEDFIDDGLQAIVAAYSS